MKIDAFWGNIFQRSLKDSDATISLLKSTPLFEELKYLDLVKMTRSLHLRKYSANEVIFRQNELGESLYIIKSGRVKLFTTDASGECRDCAVLESPGFFGETSLIDQTPRSATAVALEDTELLGFFSADLTTLIDRNPRLASFLLLHISQVVCSRLREVYKSLNPTSH